MGDLLAGRKREQMVESRINPDLATSDSRDRVWLSINE
jgi:hypothetical protein